MEIFFLGEEDWNQDQFTRDSPTSLGLRKRRRRRRWKRGWAVRAPHKDLKRKSLDRSPPLQTQISLFAFFFFLIKRDCWLTSVSWLKKKCELRALIILKSYAKSTILYNLRLHTLTVTFLNLQSLLNVQTSTIYKGRNNLLTVIIQSIHHSKPKESSSSILSFSVWS